MTGKASLIFTMALSMLEAPLSAQAQAPAKVPRIGILWVGSASAALPRLKHLREGLRDLGYLEGQTIGLEFRFAEGKFDRLLPLAAELVDLKVDVIVTFGDASIRAARQATSAIPIVVANAGDLVGPGYVASLARPGGNVTGLVDISPELSAKRVQLLKEAVPKASRVAVLWNPTNPVKAEDFQGTQAAARALRIQLQSAEVRSANDLEPAFSAMARERAGALLVLEDALTNNNRKRIVDLAARTRLPTMYFTREWTEVGGLMAYGAPEAERFRRAATYVDKILKGAKPADLPVEQPMRFELVINMNTAKALGLTFPQSILIRADHLIQ